MEFTRKQDLNSAAFSNDNTSQAGGITVRTDGASTVGGAINNAVNSIPKATAADLLTTSTSTGKVVTDDVFRTAIAAGLERTIRVATAGANEAVYGENTANGTSVAGVKNSGGGIAVIGQCNGTATGTPVYGQQNSANGAHAGFFELTAASTNGSHSLVAIRTPGSSGSGHTFYAAHSGGGTGSAAAGFIDGPSSGVGVFAYVGGLSTSTGTGEALVAANGQYGTRNAVIRADIAGANTTWGIYTNGAIFTAGGVTTSDKRVKEDISLIDGKLAYELARRVQWYTYDKLLDKSALQASQERLRKEGERELQACHCDKSEKDKEAQESHVAKVARAKEKAATSFDYSRENLSIGMQAGVIAQELQVLTKELGAFEWLVKSSQKDNPESILVVDYQSLQSIINAGQQWRFAQMDAPVSVSVQEK